MTLADLFFAVSDMSGRALAVAAAAIIMMVPILFTRAPKRLCCALLLVVVFRMACPVSIPSPISIFNVEIVRDYARAYSLDERSLVGDYEVAIEGTQEFDRAVSAGVQPQTPRGMNFDAVYYTESADGVISPATTVKAAYGHICGVIWLCGVAAFWGYGAVTYLLLRRRVSAATIVQDGVYESDRIKTTFILGVIRPRIYLPTGLSEERKKYILCHERMHLRHGDHIVKILVYCVMSVHWFNILLWMWFYRMFMLLMEQACDESVLRTLGAEARADYGDTLLAMASKRHFIGSMPVAFGETGAKDRIKSVLKYKKPVAVLTVFAVILCLFAAVMCVTDEAADEGAEMSRHEMVQTMKTGTYTYANSSLLSIT